MTSTLLIVQIVLALAITIAVLLQKSSSIGLGAYSGSNESMFGAKGPMGFLAKVTFTLALLFVLNTLVLGYLYTSENNKSVVDTITSAVPVSPEAAKVPAPTAPAAPSAPATGAESTIPAPPQVDSPQSEEAPKPATH
ncbi:MAG: preprotein translocase subunit SecG [Campylobacterota bacterium]|nr:preprotein translocase subunit SecG [Campylobacterota bacterium]